MERRTPIYPATTVPQPRHEEPLAERNEVNLRRRIGHQLQVVANELRKIVSLTIGRAEARGDVQTTLNFVLEMLARLGVAPPDINVTVFGPTSCWSEK